MPLIKNPDREWQTYTHTSFGRGNHTISTPRRQYIHYFDGGAELYDLQRDPDEFVNLANDQKCADVQEQLHQYLPKEPQWDYFVRYHNFKAVVPADGSPMLLFNLAYQNQHNEETNVAEDFPVVVSKIEDWLEDKKPVSKYVPMAN